MTLSWEGDDLDAATAQSSATRLDDLRDRRGGPEAVIANEFAEVHVVKVNTRNGVRLLIESPRSGQWITLDPLELEALTWQNEATLTAMVGHPFEPLFADDTDRGRRR